MTGPPPADRPEPPAGPAALRRARILVAVGLAVLAALLLLPLEPPAAAPGAWLEQAGVEPRFVEAGGLRLSYVRRGQGPAVILVHGVASSSYTWAEVLPGLADRHDVVALDLPGFGRSEIPTGPGGVDLMALLPAFMDRLGLDRASLVGSSLGGAVVSAVAADLPARVDRLVLIDAATFRLDPAARPFLLRVLSWVPGPVAERLPRRLAVTLALRRVFHDPARVTDERIAEYLAPLSRPGAVRALQELLRARDGLGQPGKLAAIRAPTLVVWGRHDRWFPVADGDRLAAAIPGARLVVIEDTGHLPQEERPEQVVRLLREFLSD